MCQIISYGFSVNGTQVSGPNCTAETSNTLGAIVSISVEAVDVGRSMIADIRLLFNGTSKGDYASLPYTPSQTGLWTFNIPFTGLTPQVGTYTFGADGCAYIHSPDYYSQYCYRCDTTRCTSLAVTLPPPPPCTTPSCTMTIV